MNPPATSDQTAERFDFSCDNTSWLEVRPSNTAAIALYESFGFTERGRRHNYYDLPKEDALILTRDFEEGNA